MPPLGPREQATAPRRPRPCGRGAAGSAVPWRQGAGRGACPQCYLGPNGGPEVMPLSFTLFAFSTGREDRGLSTVSGAAACRKRCPSRRCGDAWLICHASPRRSSGCNLRPRDGLVTRTSCRSYLRKPALVEELLLHGPPVDPEEPANADVREGIDQLVALRPPDAEHLLDVPRPEPLGPVAERRSVRK